MHSFFLFLHAFVVLCFVVVSLLDATKLITDKQHKKHLKKRKKFFLWFFLVSVAFLWLALEEAFSSLTLAILSSIEMLIFFGFLGWSIWKFVQDQKRIAFAKKRTNTIA